MTTEQLIVRMTTYKKEIYRRGLFILLLSFLPGCAVITGTGIALGLSERGTWGPITFVCALFLFILLNFAAFLYTIWMSLPKKLDLLCPGCRQPIMNIPPQHLLSTGQCDACGAIILNASGVPDGIQQARVVADHTAP